MFIEYLKYGYSHYFWTIVWFIISFQLSKSLIVFYKNKKRDKSRTITIIHIFVSIPMLFAFCYLMYSDINNFKAVSKGYKEFTGVYTGIKDLNDYPNRRSYEIEYEFKDNEGNILAVKNHYVIFNRFKDLEPLKTYNVTYFKDDLIREIEMLE